MSEHHWIEENLAAYVTGGLDAAERERVEQHVAVCPDCARALDEARALDGKLGQLFVSAQPAPALEDGLIQRLRQFPTRRRTLRFARGARVVAVAAAVALVALVGAVVSQAIEGEQSSIPSIAERYMPDLGIALSPTRISSAIVGGIIGGKARHAEELTLKDAETLAEEAGRKAEVSLADLDADATLGKGLGPPGGMGGPRGADLAGLESEKLAAGAKEADALAPRAHFAPQLFPGLGGQPPGGGNGLGGVGAGSPPAPVAEGGPADIYAGDQRTGKGPGQTTWGYINGMPGPQSSNGSLLYFRPGDGPSDSREVGAQAKEQKEVRDEMAREKLSDDKRVELRLEQQQVAQKKGAEPAAAAAPPAPAEPTAGRKIIRTGEIDFEVDSFDESVAIIQRLVGATRGGFIATINSDKLANGKVKGSVVLRVPPEQLDGLVTALRKELGKAGELKGQRIGSQDVTKQYIDLESRLKAARTMEERLLKIIQEGKGVIKDLVLAEKELGVWHTKIEEMEGELRYYASQVSLSSLTLNLTEKEIRLAAAVKETERVKAGIEVEDVENALRAALAAIAEAKGRVTRSELKQHAAGQFNALLNFEVNPDAAGPLRDRLRQLGTMVRLDVDRVQTAEGDGKLPMNGKLERGHTQFEISLYNLANVEPREEVVVRIAVVDVPQTYRTLRDAVAKAKGRAINAQLNEQDQQNMTAHLAFDLRRGDEAGPQAALAEAGETLSRQVNRKPEGDNVTDAKVLYRVELISAAKIPPRENLVLAVEVPKVETALGTLSAQVKEAQGRTIDSNVSLERSGRVVARVIFDVPLSAAAGMVQKIQDAGTVRVHTLTTNQQNPAGKLAVARFDVTLSNSDLLVPRDAGLWSQLHHGLSISLRGLAVSAGWLIVGVLFVLPWVLLVAFVLWLARRLWRRSARPISPRRSRWKPCRRA